MDQETCPLCRRPLGEKREKHHLVPKSLGGRDMVTLHPICHRKIHSLFTDREIARDFATIDALRNHPEVARFVRWVKGKDPDFYRRTDTHALRRR